MFYKTVLAVLFSLALSIFFISLHALHSSGERHLDWIYNILPFADNTAPVPIDSKDVKLKTLSNNRADPRRRPIPLKIVDASGPPIRWSDLWTTRNDSTAGSSSSSIVTNNEAVPVVVQKPKRSDASGPPIRWSDLWASREEIDEEPATSAKVTQPSTSSQGKSAGGKQISLSGVGGSDGDIPVTHLRSRPKVDASGPPIRWSHLWNPPPSTSSSNPATNHPVSRQTSSFPSNSSLLHDVLPPAGSSLHPAAPKDSNDDSVHYPKANNMNCSKSYPPKCTIYPYIKFWNKRFFPEDCYQSPLRPALKEKTPWDQQKFVVFQPDKGGWNNIRMAAETVIIFAHATGRTLVLPPTDVWYLLWFGKNSQENKSSFNRFFDLDKLKESMTIVSMDEFLENIAKKNLLKRPFNDSIRGENTYPGPQPNGLWNYLEVACHTERWQPGRQFIGFNLKYDAGGRPFQDPSFNMSSPRLREMVAHGRSLRPYDTALHQERCVFFPGDYREETRLLTHYYTYLYWEDLHIADIYKRIVRDRMHYHDLIFCAAGMIIKLIHEEAAALMQHDMPLDNPHPLTEGGNVFNPRHATYHAAHIRRGDFQYHDMKLPADELWKNIHSLYDFGRSRLLYIATDEKKKEFFQPFTSSTPDADSTTPTSPKIVIRFLDDYLSKLPNLFDSTGNGYSTDGSHATRNHIGMIEQIICANAHTFVGTPLSTFTGYITRMRGYYRDGRYRNTFYSVKNRMKELQQRRPLVGPFWAREFELAHKDIDDYFEGQYSPAT